MIPRPSPVTVDAGEALSSLSLSAQVYQRLLGMLIRLDIRPGARIAIDVLARELGVSPTPVREALSQLEADGLVTKTRNVGYRATPALTREQADDFYALRLLVEPFAAREAAARITAEELERLDALEEEIGEGETASFSGFASADARFHEIIARASGNSLIADTLARIHAHFHIFRALFSSGVPTQAVAEHRDIVEALAMRDGPRAEAAMRTHIQQARARMTAAFGSEAEANG